MPLSMQGHHSKRDLLRSSKAGEGENTACTHLMCSSENLRKQKARTKNRNKVSEEKKNQQSKRLQGISLPVSGDDDISLLSLFSWDARRPPEAQAPNLANIYIYICQSINDASCCSRSPATGRKSDFHQWHPEIEVIFTAEAT